MVRSAVDQRQVTVQAEETGRVSSIQVSSSEQWVGYESMDLAPKMNDIVDS